MAQFEPAFRYVMSNEDPGLTGKVTDDAGGLTRWGISQKAYPKLDIANLSLDEAMAIYARDYFAPIRGGEIQSQLICSKLMDMAVNMGVQEAIGLVQRALRLDQDGELGPVTLNAINRADIAGLLQEMVMSGEERYTALAKANPGDAKYLEGWLERARRVPAIGIAVSA